VKHKSVDVVVDVNNRTPETAGNGKGEEGQEDRTADRRRRRREAKGQRAKASED
jgi:hypothetical protein